MKYFKVEEDGVKAANEEEAVKIWKAFHGNQESEIEVNEVPGYLEVDLDPSDFPDEEDLAETPHTTVSDVFYRYRFEDRNLIQWMFV